MNVTRMRLAQACADATGITVRRCEAYLDQVLEEIAEGLRRDGQVKLTHFGKFTIHSRPERPGRNPKTGEPAIITARKSVRFSGAKSFRRECLRGLQRSGSGAEREARAKRQNGGGAGVHLAKPAR